MNGFYLRHFPVLYLFAIDIHNVSVLMAVWSMISAACTEVSWRIVEQPMLPDKDRRFAARTVTSAA